MNARLAAEDTQPAPAYPRDLALLVRQRWTDAHGKERHDAEAFAEYERALPELDVLERLISICYQASLLHDEGRQVTFRVALAEPESFIAVGGSPEGFHRLVLSRFRPFDRHELRHLASAAGFQRSLIGVHLDVDGELAVWGLVHTGPRWLQAVRGGRRAGQSFPPILMIAVTGPGRVLVSKGTKTVAALAGGTLADEASDVFAAPWLASIFADLHAAQWAEHSEAEPTSEPYRTLEPAFGRKLAEHVLRRIVATVRSARHGGTLVLLPARSASELCADGRYLTLKYPFRDEEPRRRIFSLTVRIMNELAALHPVSETQAEPRVGWAEYEASDDSQLIALDEALFEVAHLIAMLADVDGAVVMTDRLEILGFGAEISGALPEVASVDRSMDLQGTRWVRERTDRVGTRHRSAYRLCAELHEALAVVVSQDGGVRFVRWNAERVTYFDQIATGPWEV
jgi:sensor domain DACNV-containing protein